MTSRGHRFSVPYANAAGRFQGPLLSEGAFFVEAGRRFIPVKIPGMIAAASELLAAFVAAEKKKLEGVKMPHMPTLGSAYEAIAKAGIDQRFVLPPGLDLRVVSGFVVGAPNQYDLMLVQGEGERYGLLDQYFYPIEQVLCVLEVKKRLTKADLADAINHLAEVQRHFLEDFSTRNKPGPFSRFRRAVRSFERMTGRIGPRSYEELDAMPLQDSALIGVLARQRLAPVTVLFGFEGYRSEHGLRGALLDIMASEVGKETATSIDLLPTLVTAGEFSIVKCNAQPYMVHRDGVGWVATASTRYNAALMLLELLWTKISNFCDASMPWGDDMQMETLKELFALEAVPHGEAFGWMVRTFEYSEKQLEGRPASLPWAPAVIGPAAAWLIGQLGLHGGQLALDEDVAAYVQTTFGTSLDEAMKELSACDAFAMSTSTLQATSDATFLATVDDGTGYVATERGKLEMWCAAKGLTPTYFSIINL